MDSGAAIIFAILAMLSWGVADFLIQRSARKTGTLITLIAIGAIGSIGLLPFVWNDLGLLLIPGNAIIIVLLGLMVFFSAVPNLEALKQGKLSVIDVVLQIELPVTILLGFIFLGETLTMTQFIIIAFILSGIILIAVQSLKEFTAKMERGVIIAIITGLLYGVVNFLTGYSAKTMTPMLAIWVPWVMLAILSGALLLRRKGMREAMTKVREHKTLIIWTAIIDTAAWVFYALATEKASISIITAITESYPAIAIILGVWINKERIAIHQWIGAGIALVCSALLCLTL